MIYKCNRCGNVVELLHNGNGKLMCCDKEMELLNEKFEENNKHVPYIEYKEDKYIVTVGKDQKHPMNKEHYIQWIELKIDDVIYRKYLEPNQEPVAEFNIKKVPKDHKISARAYCNIHELWKSQ